MGKNRLARWVLCVGLLILLFLLLRSGGKAETEACHQALLSLNMTAVGLVIVDPVFLSEFHRNCHAIPRYPLMTMIAKDSGHTVTRELLKVFRVLPYTENDAEDFIQVQDNRTFRLLPKSIIYHQIGSVKLPANIPQFLEFWQRSREIECKNVLQRDESETNRTYPLEAIEALADIRDIIINYGAYPFLQGGTLLGWYRECSIIPHTYDMDLGIRHAEFSPSLQHHFATLPTNGPLALYRILGMPSEGYEMTVYAWDFELPVDIFIVYDEGRYSWVGGTSNSLQKYRYYYPRYTSFCSANLLGRHFFVPCNVEETIRVDYGPKWAEDWPTDLYSWSSSGKNVKKAGKWPEHMRKQVLQIFLGSASTSAE